MRACAYVWVRARGRARWSARHGRRAHKRRRKVAEAFGQHSPGAPSLYVSASVIMSPAWRTSIWAPARITHAIMPPPGVPAAQASKYPSCSRVPSFCVEPRRHVVCRTSCSSVRMPESAGASFCMRWAFECTGTVRAGYLSCALGARSRLALRCKNPGIPYALRFPRLAPRCSQSWASLSAHGAETPCSLGNKPCKNVSLRDKPCKTSL